MDKISLIQEDILDWICCSDGRFRLRELQRMMHPERYGTTAWSAALMGLIESGKIVVSGKGTKSSPKIISMTDKAIDESAVTERILSRVPVIQRLLSAHLNLLREHYIRTINAEY